MPLYAIAALSIVSLVVGVLAFGFAVVAGADPEGRGGDYIFWGLIVAALGACGFIGFGVWALVRWLW